MRSGTVLILLFLLAPFLEGFREKWDLRINWQENSHGYFFIDLDAGPTAVMGIARRQQNYQLLKWNPNASIWELFTAFAPGEQEIPVGFCQTETSVFHEMWVITEKHHIFQYRYPLSMTHTDRNSTHAEWREISGPHSQILDITASGNGAVFICTQTDLYEWNRRNYSWKRYPLPKPARKIDAQYRTDIARIEIALALEDGTTAILQPSGRRSNQFRWIPLNGSSHDVGVVSRSDSPRRIWCTDFNQTKTSWGGFIYFLDQIKSDIWQWVYPGAGCRITVDANRSPWIINREGKSFVGKLID